jgi:hypothetical protein
MYAAVAGMRKHPSSWNLGQRPKQHRSHNHSRAASCGQLKTYREIVCGEIAEALAAMDVHAPNQMQAVRCSQLLVVRLTDRHNSRQPHFST